MTVQCSSSRGQGCSAVNSTRTREAERSGTVGGSEAGRSASVLPVLLVLPKTEREAESREAVASSRLTVLKDLPSVASRRWV